MQQFILKCQVCPRHLPPKHGEPIKCGVTGKNIREHAKAEDCPQGFYTPGSHITIGKARVHRPIAGSNASSPALIESRLSVCRGCSNFSNGSCRLCGCVLASKVRDRDSSCPAEKWGKVLMGDDLWFSHTGAMGDIIYSLHAVRAATPSHLRARFYVHHDASIRPEHYMGPKHYKVMRSLVEAQPYISEFTLGDPWPTATHRLDTFRDHGFFDNNLIALHHAALGLDGEIDFSPWLTIPDPLPIAPVVVFRSNRYRNREGDAVWQGIHEKYPDKVFLGVPREHADYEDRFGKVPYFPTVDLLHAARVIKGAELVIGNQTSLFAVATGAGCRTALEVDPSIPDCCFPGFDSVHIWHRDVGLPEIDGTDRPGNTIHHVHHGFSPEGDRKRIANAKLSWHRAELADRNWRSVPVWPDYTSRQIGDERSVPLINDVLDYACNLPEDDIVVWTNLDVCLTPDAPVVIRRKLRTGDCCFCRRVDVVDATKVLFRLDLHHREVHGGTDLFAFKAGWWKRNRHLMPRMFLACEAFDFVLRRIMLSQRPTAEIAPVVLYHETHEAFWATGKNLQDNPAQKSNRKTAVAWCMENGWTHALNPEGTFLLKNDWDYSPCPQF
jgi:hypothetical protein